MNDGKMVHPYIPNSVPEVQAEMLKEIGAKEIGEFYECIPEDLRLKEVMDLPPALASEYELQRHVEGLLAKNTACVERTLNFMGGGCWQHHVPAICDEINGRSEFLTAYAGDPYEDHGRFQVLFEYCSMMGELLEMDVVNVPTYDGSQAAATSLRMAQRITGRDEVLVSEVTDPGRLDVIRNYLNPDMTVQTVRFDLETGDHDLRDLEEKISSRTAAVYFENPTFLGGVECQGQIISDLAHGAGALSVVFVDPMSLGVLNSPSRYGADIICGEIQPLGMYMYYGGARGGFISSRDEEKYVQEYPSRLFGVAPTTHREWGFGDVAWERTSFAKREEGKEFVGTAAALWGITAGVYLALMGPRGMQEIGQTILQKNQYAAERIGLIEGVRSPVVPGPFFKEFVVNFDATGRTVAEVRSALRKKNIFGGIDLSISFPQLGQSALFCVTEIHSKADIDRLAEALEEILG